MKKINKFRVWNCLQLFCDIFGILVCNLAMNHSDQERLFTVKVLTEFFFHFLYTQQKSSAQMGFQANPVLPRNYYILCYISLFTAIILQQLDAFKIEIQGTFMKL